MTPLFTIFTVRSFAPNEEALRVINSTMISTAGDDREEPMTPELQKRFLETADVIGAL
jgi:hypothetical protein